MMTLFQRRCRHSPPTVRPYPPGMRHHRRAGIAVRPQLLAAAEAEHVHVGNDRMCFVNAFVLAGRT